MKIVISIIQLLISLYAIKYARAVLISGRSSLLAVHVIVFALFNSLGIAIDPYIPSERLSFVTSPDAISYLRIVDPIIYLRQCLGHWIFLVLSLLGLRWEMSTHILSPNGRRRIPSPIFWGFVFFLIGAVFSLRYYIFGPGWVILRESRLVFSSTAEAIAHRTQGYLSAGFGQGSYLASLGAFLFFPISAALVIIRKNGINFALFAASAILSLAYAFQTRQKAPLLWTLLTYLLILYFDRRKKEFKIRQRTIFVFMGAIGSLASVALYMVNFGHSLVTAFQRFLYRVFMVPGSSEANYFVIFPDSLDFRGISKIFGIPLGKVSTGNELTVYDVAKTAVGNAYSANASFLAVSWSAAGYIGMTLASLFMVASLSALDQAFISIEKRYFYVSLALAPIYLITLVSEGISTYVGRGGLIIPLILILLTKAPAISFKSRKL